MHVEPDVCSPAELNVDTDAPYQAFPTPPAHDAGLSGTDAQTMRWLALDAWRLLVRNIRAGLIDALTNADLDDHPGRYAPYGLVDDLLRALGLPGLPHAHLYQISAAIPLAVNADNPTAARRVANRIVQGALAVHTRDGLPIASSGVAREPDIVERGDGSYRVTWHQTYLVCLRATHEPRLAEAAVRLRLGVLTDALPGIGAVPLTTEYLGEHIDHLLEPDRD